MWYVCDKVWICNFEAIVKFYIKACNPQNCERMDCGYVPVTNADIASNINWLYTTY